MQVRYRIYFAIEKSVNNMATKRKHTLASNESITVSKNEQEIENVDFDFGVSPDTPCSEHHDV